MGLILKEDCLCELDGYTHKVLYARCRKHKKIKREQETEKQDEQLTKIRKSHI